MSYVDGWKVVDGFVEREMHESLEGYIKLFLE